MAGSHSFFTITQITMSLTNKRIASIDIVRGITIAGMVLCANIGYYSDLPAWMFHAQTPPPTYAFNPDVPGITWVDLVFPFFIFAMGAAFPFAMRKRMEKGESWLSMCGSLVKRWLTLTIFALILGNAYASPGADFPAWQIQIFKIALWVALFLSLVRVNVSKAAEGLKKHVGTAVNVAGIAMLAVLTVIHTRYFGLSLSRWSSDIIIMILAVIALWGGILWMLTKDNLRLRWLVILLIAAFKALDSYAPAALEFVPSFSGISWFFTWDWLQYLLIALPGSIVGDLILNHSRSGEPLKVDTKGVVAGALALIAALVQLWGLFTRNVLADFCISAVLAASFVALTWKQRNVYTNIGWIGFALMLLGIALDPVDGGITKDYCNLSYLFTTCGMTALVTAVLLMLEMKFGVKCRFVAGVGQNPMLAYTVTSFLIGPILSMLGILPALYALAAGSQFWGVMQGVIITFLMMAVTFAFTKMKLFWRS